MEARSRIKELEGREVKPSLSAVEAFSVAVPLNECDDNS